MGIGKLSKKKKSKNSDPKYWMLGTYIHLLGFTDVFKVEALLLAENYFFLQNYGKSVFISLPEIN